MYLGALECWANDGLSNRAGLTAYGFRELLDQLPEHVGMAQEKKPNSLKVVATDVIAARRKHVKDAVIRSDGWTEKDQAGLRKFLDKFLTFEEKVAQIAPLRRERQRRVLEALDPSPGPTPEASVDLFFGRWEELVGYLNSVVHGDHDGADLGPKIERVELFLLEYLVQEPLPRRKEILDLIKKGSSDAKS